MMCREAALIAQAGRQLGLTMSVEIMEDGDPAIRANSLRELAEAASWAMMVNWGDIITYDIGVAMRQVKAIDIGTRGFLFH